MTVDRVLHHHDAQTPPDRPHCFAYFITIHNDSDVTVTIKGRKWVVKNSRGEITAVEGEGVVGQMPRIEPGGHSSERHAHSKQDEFIWVVSGSVVLETNEGRQTLGPGACAGFAAGSGNAHRFVNETAVDAFLLVIGDRTPFDEVTYPDIDNHARYGADGKYVHTSKDGTPH